MNNDVLIRVGADTAAFSRAMKEASGTLKGFTESNKATFDAFKKTGTVITAAGTAIASGLGFAVKKAADFESGMSAVAAISGATGEDLKLLTNTAREMGSKTSFSAK